MGDARKHARRGVKARKGHARGSYSCVFLKTDNHEFRFTVNVITNIESDSLYVGDAQRQSTACPLLVNAPPMRSAPT